MASNVVLTGHNVSMMVPRETVQKWITRLNRYIGTANFVSNQSTFASISRAETSLHKAKELYSVLWDMNVPGVQAKENEPRRDGSLNKGPKKNYLKCMIAQK